MPDIKIGNPLKLPEEYDARVIETALEDSIMRVMIDWITSHKHDGTLNNGGFIAEDNSASGYFKIGNMMIQWGTVSGLAPLANGAAQSMVTFPVAFKTGSTPKVTVGFVASAVTEILIFRAYTVTNVNFYFRVFNHHTADETNCGGDWIAIGLIA